MHIKVVEEKVHVRSFCVLRFAMPQTVKTMEERLLGRDPEIASCGGPLTISKCHRARIPFLILFCYALPSPPLLPFKGKMIGHTGHANT